MNVCVYVCKNDRMRVMPNTEGMLCHDMCIRILATVCTTIAAHPKAWGLTRPRAVIATSLISPSVRIRATTWDWSIM